MLRERSRTTSCSAFHDGSASSGASNSFSIQAENRFSVSRFHEARSGQTAPAVACGGAAGVSRTVISRAIAAQPDAPVNFACQTPGAGAATSAYQEYGGPSKRLFELAATLPSGPISDSSPSSGFSAATSTRSGTPFHGAKGAGSMVISFASLQALAGVWACARASEAVRPIDAPAISNAAVAAKAKQCARGTCSPPYPRLDRPKPYYQSFG